MKNILITGGSGFVGRNLSEKLCENYNIFCPKHSELELLDYDELFSFIKEKQIDVIIHAAIHVPQINGIQNEFFNDVKMFMNMEKVSSSVEKIIYFGSGAEYDKRYDIRNVTEADFGRSIPTSEYGLAKYTMTELARVSRNIYNLRLFGIFGKYEPWQIKFLSNLCCKAVYDLPLTVRKDCWFNFIYIEDLADIVEWFVENTPVYHDYNVCHDQNYLLSDLADKVRKVSRKKLEIRMLSNERNLDYTANNARLRAELSSIHITPMERAIEDLYTYYFNNQKDIDYNVLKETK